MQATVPSGIDMCRVYELALAISQRDGAPLQAVLGLRYSL
jgi:hypothetical protein